MAEDITVTTMEGRPVDPQVPGTTHDMDAAVATLLARHDATRTDGNPPWPPSWARYGTMWEERDKALAEVDRLRAQVAEQRTIISEIALEREQALAEAHRLRGEWEDAIANNEGVWEEGFHKGREYQREAERRG